MEEQIFYSKQLAKTLLFAAVALMAGVAMGSFLLKGASLMLILAAGVVVAGIPCGCEMADRVLGSSKNLNLLGIGVKLLIAGLIGWAVLPVRVIYCAVKCCAPWEEEVAYAA